MSGSLGRAPADCRAHPRSVVPLRPHHQPGKGLSAAYTAITPPHSPLDPPFNIPFSSSFSFEHVGLEHASVQAGPSENVAFAGIKRERHHSGGTMFSAATGSAQLESSSGYPAKSGDLTGQGRRLFGGIWNSWVGKKADEDADEEDRANKKRKGMAGVILTTAIEAAVFTGAVGYAAYQLWRSRGTQPDNPTDQVNPPPPPYTPQDPTLSTHTPSNRKVTHVHAARPRYGRGRLLSGNHSSSHEHIDRAINQVDGALAQTAAIWGTDLTLPPRSSRLTGKPAQTWSPSSLAFGTNNSYFSPPENSKTEEGGHQKSSEQATETEEEDPTMVAFEARIQALISTGQAALASRPSLSGPSPTLPRSVTNESLSKVGKASYHSPQGTPVTKSKRWNNQDSPSGIPRLAQVRRNTTTATTTTLNSMGGSSSRIVASPEVQQLSKALEVTAKGTGKRWCD